MLKAGFSRVDITPPLGTNLAGYFKLRVSDGVLDPLEVNALAMENEGEQILVMTGDFMYMSETMATFYREKIQEKCGIPASHILFQSVHQHTSFHVGDKSLSDQAYLDILERRIVDVAAMALADLADARLEVAEKETEKPISFIRRYRMRDGSTRTNPGWLNPDMVEPIGKADNTVRLLRFFREEKEDIALVNFNTHPDVIGGTKISADWPGFVRRMVEEDLGVHCILVNGPQGDTNHIDFTVPKWTCSNYEFSRGMGRTIADTVKKIWDQTQPIRSDKVTGAVQIPRTQTNLAGVEHLAEYKEIWAKYQAGEIAPSEIPFDLKGEMRRIVGLENAPLFQKVAITVLGLGEVVFVGFGGEPFTEYITELREKYPDLLLIGACIANGGEGYFPSASAYAEGGYEARTSNFTFEVASVIKSTSEKLIEAHRKQLN